MHTTLQSYLDTMYDSTIKNADSLDLPIILYESLGEEFLKSKKQHDKNPCTKSELKEFYQESPNWLMNWGINTKKKTIEWTRMSNEEKIEYLNNDLDIYFNKVI